MDICGRLGDPFCDMNVYPNPDLQLLSEMGVRFVILEGCWAGGMVNSLDFRFPGGKDTSTGERSGMFRKDEDNVAFYSSEPLSSAAIFVL